MHSFQPSDAYERDLRDALGRYATGVTVVTVQTPEGPVGITANSFTSVSLDPPLVLWCLEHRSSRFAAFRQASHFSIHVLADDQHALSDRFARSGGHFDGLSITRTPEGVPALSGCLARFDCALHTVHEGGDHAIFVGRVERVQDRPGRPLVFWGRRYGSVRLDD